jgi:hypothetical protein
MTCADKQHYRLYLQRETSNHLSWCNGNIGACQVQPRLSIIRARPEFDSRRERSPFCRFQPQCLDGRSRFAYRDGRQTFWHPVPSELPRRNCLALPQYRRSSDTFAQVSEQFGRVAASLPANPWLAAVRLSYALLLKTSAPRVNGHHGTTGLLCKGPRKAAHLLRPD